MGEPELMIQGWRDRGAHFVGSRTSNVIDGTYTSFYLPIVIVRRSAKLQLTLFATPTFGFKEPHLEIFFFCVLLATGEAITRQLSKAKILLSET